MARNINTGTDTLTAEVDDHGVAVITMNRPERRNAMTDGFGLIAFASLFPILSVMAYAQLSELRAKLAMRRKEKERASA